MTSHTTSILDGLVAKGTKLTPMMEQYYQIKKQYSEMLLMFRMGDFYELFFEDAIDASKILNISLTHRGKIGETKIPMAGIPHHAASTYIDRITAQGMKVAICEQVEDPKAAKGIVKRAVTQVVSPGMPYDLDKSEKKENSYIASGYKFSKGYYLVLIDFTTGDFLGLTLPDEQALVEQLELYRPKEFVTYLGQWDKSKLMRDYLEGNILRTNLSMEYFEEKFTSLYIEKLIPTYKRDEVLKLHQEIIHPISAISYYICSTQSLESLTHIRPFQLVSFKQDMKITYPTLVGLEILPKSIDRYKDSILGFMDKTQTALGARKLKQVFQAPLRDLNRIEQRQEVIGSLIANEELRLKIQDLLKEIRDIERIMAKTSTGKVNGSDLLCLAKAVENHEEILKLSKKLFNPIIPTIKTKDKKELQELAHEVLKTINDEIGANLEKGNLIKPGCCKKRDRLKKKTDNVADQLIDLETRYREETGITNLKIKHNNVAGYFIEVSKSHTKKVPSNFERRQTLVNSERYQSEELANFEQDIIVAKEKLLKLEREIFDSLVIKVKEISLTILNLADSIALIDVMQNLAELAFEYDFTRPELTESEKVISIQGAWHPLIKANIKDQFVAHDIELNTDSYFGLITGPNMAGKTTVMREVAIIQLLSQIGSYVPANVAKLSLCDYIFSRLGASDDIIKGQSTFMVEMSETAEIIRHATDQSLIVLDEIGRGTSTYDGLSIAWSLVEFFVKETKALTLFSTHYHELIDLVESLDGAKNFTVKTINENGNVQFLYKLIEEGAAQSFGIHVAKLAGLPPEILNRSSELLHKLETQDLDTSNLLKKENKNQLDMFTPLPQIKYEDIHSPLLRSIEGLDLNNMTPLEAMNKLVQIQEQLMN
jgi:DNA mismatch repair protein MutS